MAASSFTSVASPVEGLPQKQHRVFINFRGDELRNNFISHLETALNTHEIIYCIDTKEARGQPIEILFQRIEESDIALAVFSKRYSESKWCLNELGKIMQRVEEEKLKVIPIFFYVKVDEVKQQKGEFDLKKHRSTETAANIQAWKKALESATQIMGLVLATPKSESQLIVEIVKGVKDVIAIIETGQGTNMLSTNISSSPSSSGNAAAAPRYGRQQCLEQLGEKLDFECEQTQIVGIVGMPGIGKTTLAKMHLQTWSHKFLYNKLFQSKDPNWVKNELLSNKGKKVLIVIDDVIDKIQLDFLQSNPELIKEGSKIVITTRDKGLIEGIVHDTYVVPGLNDIEALKLFTDHAFKGQDNPRTKHFDEMSKTFVDYAGGNPRALKELGNELFEKDEAHWKERISKLPYRCNPEILTELSISYDKLTEQQKDAFLDIACFFRSEEEDYVRTILDSPKSASDTESGEAAREVRDLADKFLLNIFAGRIEMHNLLCTMGKEIGSSVVNNFGKTRLWNHEVARDTLLLKKGEISPRGIFLDTSKIAKGIALSYDVLITMHYLRYLKIYDSCCPRQCEVDCKVNLPDGLIFPLKEIRYLHWLKFPLKEFPSDFNPENLIDLRLPYSKILRVWEGIKDTPKLKWVDLSHSTKLIDMSALSKAESLQRLNLEGCTMLVELPGNMESMKSLAFLNLRGCTSLLSLPKMKSLTSLKTLILSNCSKFKEFQVISENLEYLHLDGTAIAGLPSTIQNLGRLIVLNLKDCKKLESLPDCLGKLKALEELILSGCSTLESFPDVKEIMENLQILLLDGTSIKELPNGLLHCGNNSLDQVAFQRRQPRMNGLSLLQRLCLSGNDEIKILQSSISQLYHLKWIDLKYCKKLESLSTLPPNLLCLDAHDCTSLKTVASPLALLLPLTEQVPSSFIFTNCEKLDHVATKEIICYAHNKSRLISDAWNRHNKGLAFEALVSTCFPGSEVPTWFNHRASGAALEPELPRHWSESGVVGIALCAIVSFQDYKIQNNNHMVKCRCDFNNVVETTSSSFFDCNIGSLSEAGDEKNTIKSTHVFIGYTSLLNNNKRHEEVGKKGCCPTKASITFEVTDGTCEAANCEVLKCGFSLFCEPDNGSWGANADASPIAEEANQGEGRILGFWRRIKWFFTL